MLRDRLLVRDTCAGHTRMIGVVLLVFAAITQTSADPASPITILAVEGQVEYLLRGADRWLPAQNPQLLPKPQILRPGDRIQTGPNARTVLRWSDQSIVRLGPLTDLEILDPPSPTAEHGFSFWRGLLYFLHRERPADLKFRTRHVTAAVRGTEFHLEVDPLGDKTVLTVLDGTVDLTDAATRLSVQSAQEITLPADFAPAITPVLDATHVIQWALYYPAILDVEELDLLPADQVSLAASLAAFRSGRLREAFAAYPSTEPPQSAAARVYHAALLLAIGEARAAETVLLTVRDPPDTRPARLAAALHRILAAVRQRPAPFARLPQLATEWIAESYQHQAAGDLRLAHQAARQAVAQSPHFGFGWVRVAELEFSFGRSRPALDALERGRNLAPHHAEAAVLQGFLLASMQQFRLAHLHFEEALRLDSALANAWLGRGLCHIRDGRLEAGRQDLLTAAALEPQRSLLRSYLAKADLDSQDFARAESELLRAQTLDPGDPTPWFYRALLHQQQLQINEGIRALEHSMELNNNRRVFRSRLLLDQDRAVRSVNLASLYRDAGMFDLSVREAGRAVNQDYANHSAHLFLANSYQELRDPRRINLRYETPAEAEYLVANLLAPAGAGAFTPTMSPHEYSRLFERPGFGLNSATDYYSHGAWTQSGGVQAADGVSALAFESFYGTDNGYRPNQDFEELALRMHLKSHFTPRDSLYLRALYYEANGGDRLPYYDPSEANNGLRTREYQAPTLTLGYHHEWQPGLHTLAVFHRLHDHYEVQNPSQITFLVASNDTQLDYVEAFRIRQDYRSTLEIYAGEAQQVYQTDRQSTVLGTRFQAGTFQTRNLQTDPQARDNSLFPSDGPAAQQSIQTPFQRVSAYLYHHLQVLAPLRLTAGIAYDAMRYPVNFRAAPVSDQTDTTDQWSPKAGIVWTPSRHTVLRAAYTRSLSGASIDQSAQIEPTQVAGFNQSFRSIFPEALGGANVAAPFETWGASVEQRFPTGTYLSLTGEILSSTFDRELGVFLIDFLQPANPWTLPWQLGNEIDYQERSLVASVDQLLGREWSVGVSYRLRDSRIEDVYPAALQAQFLEGGFRPEQVLDSTLHQILFRLIYNHPSGFFGQFNALHSIQSNRGHQPEQPGDRFWQFNAFAGYRFRGRTTELRLGILNLTDQDYRLSPLTFHQELPRERTFTARLQINL